MGSIKVKAQMIICFRRAWKTKEAYTSDEGHQDNKEGHDSSNGEQGSHEESKTSNDGEETEENEEHNSTGKSDDDTFNGDRGIILLALNSYCIDLDMVHG